MTEAALETFGSEALRATVSARGAELVRLQDRHGRDLLWGGDPAVWSGRSPLLFPIVGRLKGDRALVDGVPYQMKQHGIARTALFETVARDETGATLRLEADAETREAYPFQFTLDATYRIEGATLSMLLTARNTGDRPMPVAAGFHPGFRWPLPGGGDRLAHVITFEQDEPEPIREVRGGLLQPEGRPSPVRDRVLPLTDTLFERDALIWLSPRSRSLSYGAPGGPALRIDFPDMPQLGIWSKPGASGFVCLEPWAGYASPDDFDGELADKPGSVLVPPGGAHAFSMSVTYEADA